MNKFITLSMALMLATISIVAQTYHEDDKEGLRMFLRQASAQEGKINAEQLGLAVTDTLNWQTEETWVTKVASVTWNNESPKRVALIGYYTPGWGNSNLAGVLDASKWAKLQTLSCTWNKLTALDVSANTDLEKLSCFNNQLTALDLSANIKLASLWCGDNLLTILDISANVALTDLNCINGPLTALDVSANTALTSLSCGNNQLTILNVSKNTELISLSCGNNQLTALDVSKNTALRILWCNSNPLTALDVSKNTALTNLVCNNNQLTVLDVSENTALTSLECYYNRLTALDVSVNTALISLRCHANSLTALDISANTNLEWLSCFSSQLTTLDISANTALTSLNCYGNQLTTLDISANTALTSLECYNNQLTALDISANTALTSLNCYGNQLTALDLSANTELTNLQCYNNHLPLSDLFAASEKITEQNNKRLGTQNLRPQTVVIGSAIDYSDQILFGDTYTEFTVTQNNNPASESDYIITEDGKIIFTGIGKYTVTMTNEAIVSHATNPAKVMVEITVTEGAGIGTFSGMAREGAVSFTIEDVVYVGLGAGSDGTLSDFWKYSEEYSTWIQIADFAGGARTGAVVFALNGKAYVGLGRPSLNYLDAPLKDFYEYDPSTDQWTKCANDFGGTARYGAVCFVIEDKAYVGTGESSAGTTKDFWSFDGTTWTQLSSNFSGDKRRGATAFVVNNKAYVTGGFYDDAYFVQLSDVQEYDPTTNTWRERIFADGLNLSTYGATAFSYNGKGYICYGTKKFIVTYDPATNRIENLGDELNFVNGRNYPVSFVFQGVPYVGLGSSYSGLYDTNYHSDIVPLFEPTSIKTPAIDAIHISPNPVLESFRISGITENTLVGISDINGNTVLQCIVSPDDAVFVEYLPKGMYIVRAAGKTVKMIKQ